MAEATETRARRIRRVALRGQLLIDDPLLKVHRMMESYVGFAQREKGLFDLMVGPRILAKDAYEELNQAISSSFNLVQWM